MNKLELTGVPSNMLNSSNPLDSISNHLERAIIRDPITISPQATVSEGIALMSRARSYCEADPAYPLEKIQTQLETRSRCLIVVESNQVVGIFTERDVVHLCAQQQSLDGILISQVMTAPVPTLRYSEFVDLLVIITVLQQSHARHLPIVDDQDCLIGLVTYETLRRVLQPIDLFQLPLAREAMTQPVITADPTDSLLSIAQRMASDHVSCVVVVNRNDAEGVLVPIGMVTEQDLVQLQALALDFKCCSIDQVMSSPVVTVPEAETLVTVQKLMEQHLIRRVVVTGDGGELLGIITQSNLMQALNPLDLYQLNEVFEARVKQLETEKIDSLVSLALDLESQVAYHTQKLQKQIQREQVIADVATQIRSSLSLQTILDTAVQKIHQVLGCDRVNIWRFESDHSAVVVAESTESTYSLMGEVVRDECYRQYLSQVYRPGHVRLVSDIYSTEMADCHRQLLIRLHTRAKVLMPLYCGEQLWGLLNVSESQMARDWQAEEIDLLHNLVNQLTIAIQQASTHERLQIELQERQHAETILQVRNDLLTQIAMQENLNDILNHVCTTIEGMLSQGVRCSILLLDGNNQLRDGAAPSLPDQYRRQVDGIQIGEGVGSCGTAIHRREMVIVADIAHDPLWRDFKDLALESGLRACWSQPIVAADQAVLGTFAVYYPEIHSPSADEIALVDGFIAIVWLAIQRQRNEIALEQTHQRLHQAQRLAHLGNWEQDLEHNTVYWSDEIYRIFELDPTQSSPSVQAFLDLIHPDDRATANAAFSKHLSDLQPYSLVHRLLMPDGRIKYLREHCETSVSVNGIPRVLRGTAQDITQQQQAELQCDRAEASLRQVIEGTAIFTGEAFFPALVSHIAKALAVRYALVSQSTPEGFQVLAFWGDGELRHPEFFPYDALPCCYQALRTGICYHPCGLQALYPDNLLLAHLQAESYLGVSLHNAVGETTGILCILHDTPLADPNWAQNLLAIFAARAGAELERLHTVKALEKLNTELEERVFQRTIELAAREALLQDFLDNANDLIQMVNIHTGRFEFVNQAWRQVLGYTAGEVEQLTLFDVLAPDCVDHCQQTMAAMQAGVVLELKQVELTFLHKSGRPVLVEGSINCRFDVSGDGRPQTLSTRAIFRDVTAKKAAEQELQRREARYRALLEGASDAILLATPQGYLIEANQKAALLLGYDCHELIGMHFTHLHSPEDLPRLVAAFESLATRERFQVLDIEFLRKDGERVPVDVTASVIEVGGETIIQGIFHDIRERRQAEQALRESEIRFRRVFESNVVGMMFTDFSGRISDANDCFLQMLGYSRQDLEAGPDLNWVDLTPGEYWVQDQARIALLKHSNVVPPFEKAYRHKDGHLVQVLIGLAMLSNHEKGCVAVVVDISDRKRAEVDLQRQLLAIESAVNGIAILEREHYIYLNSAHIQMFGYEQAEELLGQSWRMLYAPAELERFDREIFPALLVQSSWQGEVLASRKDGSTFPQQLSLTCSADNLLICVGQDISDRKAAERLIYQQASRETLLREITQRIHRSLDLQTIFDTACQEIRQVLEADRVGIFKFYPNSNWDDGEFVAESVAEEFMSAMAVRFHDHCFGEKYAPLYLQGRYAAMEDIFQLNDQCHTDVLAQIQVRANLVMPLRCGEQLWGLLCIHQCSGPRQWQESEALLTQQLASQLAIAIQQANLFEQLQQELVERQQAQAQLTERNEQLAISNTELARATRLKDEFLANMSHELRTPLNAILGMTEGLQDEVFGIINEKQLNAMNTVEKSATHLLSLINDILDVAKIESGKIELDPSYIAVEQLCSSSLAFIKQQALKKNIRLKTEIPPHLSNLCVDEIRIRQVLLNLLTNAVKFTLDGGTVTLTVSVLPSEPITSHGHYLRIAVSDTGIGISPENISRLFKPFVQIDSALNRKYTGTGLGLALVKQIVELHGGQVGLTSEFGVGSCFTIDLPYELQEPATSHPTALSSPSESDLPSRDSDQNPPQPPLILLAEDNPDNVATITGYLEAKGYRLLVANDGQEAIDLASSHYPDAILMDVQMPGMDGLEAMRQIRQQQRLCKIPVICLTALAMKGDQERCLEAGADYYLSKPVRLKQLDSSIKDLLAQRALE